MGPVRFPPSPPQLTAPLTHVRMRQSLVRTRGAGVSEAGRLQSRELHGGKAKALPGPLRPLGPGVCPPFFSLRLKECCRSESCDSLRIRRLLMAKASMGKAPKLKGEL